LPSGRLDSWTWLVPGLIFGFCSRQRPGPVGPASDPGARMFAETTKDIRITVKPMYLEDQSEPSENRYLWAYKIIIDNLGNETVQLLTRYWKITDANGRVQEVRGDGVVGEQPVIPPGKTYEYTSGCPLDTPSGFMVGSYDMVTDEGQRLEVAIPLLPLDLPGAAPQLH